MTSVSFDACDIQSGTSGMAEQYRRLLREHRRPLCQVCRECEHPQFPPMLLCPRCGSAKLEWRDVGGEGTVRSWVTVHTTQTTAGFTIPKWLVDAVPYSSVFVQPDALTETLRLPSLMTGVNPNILAAGIRVVLEVGGAADFPVVVSRVGDQQNSDGHPGAP